MNKTELIAAVAEKAGLSKKDSDAAVNAVLCAITDALKAGDKVQLVGFGSFETKKRAARTGQNPRTGAAVIDRKAGAVAPAFSPEGAIPCVWTNI